MFLTTYQIPECGTIPTGDRQRCPNSARDVRFPGNRDKVEKGVFRWVLCIGNLAFKVPRLRNPLKGMRCNRWEREMWQTWRPIFGWRNLCPIYYADPLGMLVVMPRAEQPVTFEDVVNATSGEHDYYPDITAETKPEDYGRVGTLVLALDYGLPDADMVDERRSYYKSKVSQGNDA